MSVSVYLSAEEGECVWWRAQKPFRVVYLHHAVGGWRPAGGTLKSTFFSTHTPYPLARDTKHNNNVLCTLEDIGQIVLDVVI